MSGPVGSLMRAAFGKSEEMTTGCPEVSGCRQFFVVPNANWNRRHEEMIRIDGERGGGEFVINSFFFYPHELDVVLHPRQSLDLSSRGTTSPAPAGHSADWTWCLTPGQSLEPSSRGTTSPAPAGSTVMPTWCFTPAKALIFRRGAPRRPRPTGLQ